jgi:hypothetical protein
LGAVACNPSCPLTPLKNTQWILRSRLCLGAAMKKHSGTLKIVHDT